MSLKKVGTVFMVIGFCCLTCGVIMGLEVIHNRLNPNRNNEINSIIHKKLILIGQKLNELIHTKNINDNDELLYHEAMKAIEEI
jgi:hypothetical protein